MQKDLFVSLSNLSIIAHDECDFHYVVKSRLMGGVPVVLLHRSFNIGLYNISLCNTYRNTCAFLTDRYAVTDWYKL